MDTRETIRAFVSNDPFSGIPAAQVLGGIVGGEQPSRYSQSPALWNRFFENLGIEGQYTAFDLPDADRMKEFLEAVFSLPGFVDLTVTNPFKAHAFEAIGSLPWPVKITQRARLVQSLNHLTKNPLNGEITADTTDGEGMIRALKKRTSLRGKKAVLAGAGGAALSIGYELLEEGADVTIVNIIAEDGYKLAEFLASCRQGGAAICALPWDKRLAAASSADIVISAITTGTPLDESMLEGLRRECLFADARYGDNAEFARLVRGAGLPCVDGREMLYGQFRVVAETLHGLAGSSPDFMAKTLDAVEDWFCAF